MKSEMGQLDSLPFSSSAFHLFAHFEACWFMFYVLSKVIFFLIAPSHLCAIFLGAGLILLTWQSTQRLAHWLLMISLSGFVIFGFSPLGNAMLLPLEERFPRPETISEGRYAGIIMLGGFENGNISRERKTLALNEAAERLSETVRLARRLPQTRVIFSGGAGSVLLEARDARAAVESYLRDVGILAERLVLESQSRNTWENAVFLKILLKPAANQQFLLVTSAWHMPRAIGVFRRAGFRVVAYPVDYRVQGPADLLRPFSTLHAGLRRVDRAAKEWIGLVGYWLSDRSTAPFPRP